LNGKPVTAPLKSWEQMGMAIAGPGTYRKQFTAAAAPAGKRVFLEIADAHEYARVTLNGKELEAHAWQPYRWEVTSALKAGSNELEIQVYATPAGRGGSAPAAPTGATPAAGAGRGGRGNTAAAAPTGPAPVPQGPPGSALALNGPGGGVRPELRTRGVFSPAASGILGPVRLVAR
jgi:hypothetical protein